MKWKWIYTNFSIAQHGLCRVKVGHNSSIYFVLRIKFGCSFDGANEWHILYHTCTMSRHIFTLRQNVGKINP